MGEELPLSRRTQHVHLLDDEKRPNPPLSDPILDEQVRIGRHRRGKPRRKRLRVRFLGCGEDKPSIAPKLPVGVERFCILFIGAIRRVSESLLSNENEAQVHCLRLVQTHSPLWSAELARSN